MFGQIANVDFFVHYDDVQLDKRGWRHRNLLKGPRGSSWITIPLSLPGGTHGTSINDARISAEHSEEWQRKHWSAIRSIYERAPYFQWLKEWIYPFYELKVEHLVDITIPLTECIAKNVGIRQPEFLRSSALAIAGERSERLLKICKTLGADEYVSGPAAESYLDVALFKKEGVNVNFVSYEFQPYQPLHGDYDPKVSILDYLVVRGPTELDDSIVTGIHLRPSGFM